MAPIDLGEIETGRCLVVAEIAQAHDGSLGNAHAYIDAVAGTGASAIKFQTHIAEAESLPTEPWRVKFSPQDETRYEYWKRMEFTEAEWHGLAEHARQVGLHFLSTPFSIEAVELLERVGVAAWKIGSGDANNFPLIRRVASYGLPVLLSSGMSSWSDLDKAVAEVRAQKAPLGVFQCTTSYPCPPEKVGLNVIGEISRRYACVAGLSDHSGTIFPSIAATALGARMVEVHVVFSRDCFGPDTPASITIQELKSLVDGIRFVESALGSPVSKDHLAQELEEVRRIFGRSLVARCDLREGHTVAASDLALKKPGGGLPPEMFDFVVGKRLTRPVSKDVPLTNDMFET